MTLANGTSGDILHDKSNELTWIKYAFYRYDTDMCNIYSFPQLINLC